MSVTEGRRQPAFTVITPVFNGGDYLLEAVHSVLAQTLPDFELVLVDDGSTDDACDVVLGLKDDRIRVLHQAHLGAAAACNLALTVAQGEFVAFLDQDDLWAPRKLERQVECFHENPGVDLTFTWFDYIGERGQVLGFQPRRWRGGVEFEHLLRDNVIGATSPVAIRRAAIEEAGGFDPALEMTYDLDLYLRVLQLRPGNALALPEVLAMYRRHPAQMSRDWRTLQHDWEKLLAKYSILAPDAVRRQARSANTQMYRYFATVAYERRDFAGGLQVLMTCLRRDPAAFVTSPRHWRVLFSCLVARGGPPAARGDGGTQRFRCPRRSPGCTPGQKYRTSLDARQGRGLR
jgi:glycosyltransferase involved in cell wall biosynthesis